MDLVVRMASVMAAKKCRFWNNQNGNKLIENPKSPL